MDFVIHRKNEPDFVLSTPFSLTGCTADIAWLAKKLVVSDATESGFSFVNIDTDEDREYQRQQEEYILAEAERIKRERSDQEDEAIDTVSPEIGSYYRMRNGEICGPIDTWNPILVIAPITPKGEEIAGHPPYHAFDMMGESTWKPEFDLVEKMEDIAFLPR